MTLISSIVSPFVWLWKQISAGAKKEAPIAVTITEAVKTVLANPVANLLENIFDAVTGTKIAEDAANAINAEIPKILAAELAIEGLPANPTADDILAFENRVLAAFNISSDNSRLYTVLGAQVYSIINTTIQSGKPVTFAVLVADIEAAYQDYQADLAANTATEPVHAPAVPIAVAQTPVAAAYTPGGPAPVTPAAEGSPNVSASGGNQ